MTNWQQSLYIKLRWKKGCQSSVDGIIVQISFVPIKRVVNFHTDVEEDVH
jgi:hypothetical protein